MLLMIIVIFECKLTLKFEIELGNRILNVDSSYAKLLLVKMGLHQLFDLSFFIAHPK